MRVLKVSVPPVASLWIGLLASFAGLAFYLMRPDVAGFLYDDGMYLMVAKALATGEGYRLTGIVGQPDFYKYPPLYPLLLAGGWLINPDFPNNIAWLKGLNILLSTLTLGLWGYYFQKIRQFPVWISLLLVAIIGTNWRFLEVSIELMAEPLFMLSSTLSLILCHRFRQRQTPFSIKQITILASLGVAAFYTRTMALPLILGTALWLWLTGQRKQAAGYGASSILLMLPWLFWSGSRKDTTEALGDFLVRTFQETYFQSFRMDLKYEYSLFELVGKGVQELIGNFSVQFFPLLERFFLSKPSALSETLILGLSFALIGSLGRYTFHQLKARQFSPEGIYVSLYLSLLPFWSFYKFYPRFMLPLLPLLMGFLVTQAMSLQPNEHPPHKRTMFGLGVALIVITIGLNVTQLAPYFQKEGPNALVADPKTKITLWPSYQETFQFIKEHTPDNSRFYIENTDESYFYALNTHRPTFDHFLFLPKARLEQRCPQNTLRCLQALSGQSAATTLSYLQRKSANYIVCSTFQIIKLPRNNGRLAYKQSTLAQALQKQPLAYRPIFQTTDGRMTIYQFHPSQIHPGQKDQ